MKTHSHPHLRFSCLEIGRHHGATLSLRRSATPSAFRLFLRPPDSPRRRLATRAKMAAPAGNDDTPDGRPAAIARPSCLSIHAMVVLIAPAAAVAVHKIRNRGAMLGDCAQKNFL